MVAGFAEQAFWMIPAGRQADRLRMRSLHATLRQEIAWYDTEGDTGSVIAALHEDTSYVQRGVGEKVRSAARVKLGFGRGGLCASGCAWVMRWRQARWKIAVCGRPLLERCSDSLCHAWCQLLAPP